MSRLSPLLQLALLDQLGIVDGGQVLSGGSDPAVPEVIAPVGVNRTDLDTGTPANFFKQTIGGSDFANLGIAAVAILGLFFIVKAVG